MDGETFFKKRKKTPNLCEKNNPTGGSYRAEVYDFFVFLQLQHDPSFGNTERLKVKDIEVSRFQFVFHPLPPPQLPN